MELRRITRGRTASPMAGESTNVVRARKRRSQSRTPPSPILAPLDAQAAFIADIKEKESKAAFEGSNHELLPFHLVPDYLQEKFVLANYRRPTMTVRECLRSIFSWHNEVRISYRFLC